MDPVPPRSLPCDPTILSRLQQATRKEHVRQLFERHDVDALNRAWKQLTPTERSSLTLCRLFDGIIIPDAQEPGADPSSH